MTVPTSAKVSLPVRVSSSGKIIQGATLPAIAQYIRVNIVQGFDDSLRWRIDLD
jgi:hypothetical protein